MASLSSVFAAVVCVFVSLHTCNAAGWKYVGENGVDHWATDFPDYCSGQKQSPIDLKSSCVYYSSGLEAFDLRGFDSLDGVSWTLLNNGHTAQVTYTGGNLEVHGGSLGAEYKVAQFHFHWGSDNTKGSEHNVDGNKYPMEVHIVCYNKNYADLGEAVGEDDGLAVLGFFFEIQNNDNPTFQKLVDNLPQIKHAGNATTNITPFKLTDLIAGYQDYYRYQGGLTTPTCNEVVTWTVFKNTIKISNQQMRAFRALKDKEDHAMVNNFRPPQALGTRLIQASFQDENFASASTPLAFTTLTLLSSLMISLGWSFRRM